MPTVLPAISGHHVGSFQHVDLNVQRHLNVPKTELSGLQVRILGIPSHGAKSRVETQIKICLQLVTSSGEKASSWSHLQLPEHLIAKEKLKASGKKEFLNIPKKDILHLTVSVLCASDPSKKVSTCFGCVQRERKRMQKRKESSQKTDSDPASQVVPDLSSDNIQIEQQRIVIFNSSELVDFSSGDIILPTRLTCYCRHHDEKVGFCLQFMLSDHTGNLVATGVTPPIMITDDHKSSKSKGVKRPRTDSTPIPLSSTPLQDDIITPSIPCSTQMVGFQDQTPSSQTSPQYSESNEKFELFDLDLESALSPSELLSDNFRSPAEVGEISRVVPASGPLRGGIEVTVLGSGFTNGIKIMFGENESSTHFWSPTTLICILPPSTTPGFVPVTIKHEIDMSRVSSPQTHHLSTPGSTSSEALNHYPTQNQNVKNEYDFVENLLNPEAVMFNYQEDTDRALLELALQIVGLKLTGRVEDSKRIAMAILNNAGAQNPQPNGTPMETHVTQTLQKLLEHPSNYECSLSLCNDSQHTLLHLSVILNYPSLCSFLISHGVEMDKKDLNGMTPLHFASWMGRVEIAKMLIEAGSNVESMNIFGQTPKDITAPINKAVWDVPTSPPTPPVAIQQPPVRPPTAMDMFIRGSQQFFLNHPFKQSKPVQPQHPSIIESQQGSLTKVEKVRRRKRDRMIFNFWLPLFIVVVALASLQYGLITDRKSVV